MAGFVDVLLRGLALVCASVVLGGVVWAWRVLRAEPHAKPDHATRLALRVVAVAAAGVAATQIALMAVALTALAHTHGTWPIARYFETAFARVALMRTALGIGVAALAWALAHRPAGTAAWRVLLLGASALVAASAVLSHAVARVEGRGLLLVLDAVHQMAAAVWVGGLAHLVIYAARVERRDAMSAVLAQRFSRTAQLSVGALAVAGVGLTLAYVGDVAAFVGTAYGVMILSKVLLFAVALAFAAANFRMARAAVGVDGRLAPLRGDRARARDHRPVRGRVAHLAAARRRRA